MDNAKKYRKTIEWERLEISSRKSDTKGTFHAKTGTIKNRKIKNLTKADIKKRWQEYTEWYKKGVNDPITTMVWSSHLEPDILECEVK